jgi:hypothetical protein
MSIARILLLELCEYDTTRARHGRRMMASERVRAKGGLGSSVDTLNPFWGGLFLGILHSWNTCALFSVFRLASCRRGRWERCMYLCIHNSRRRYSLTRQDLRYHPPTLSMGLFLLPNPAGRGPVQSCLARRSIQFQFQFLHQGCPPPPTSTPTYLTLPNLTSPTPTSQAFCVLLAPASRGDGPRLVPLEHGPRLPALLIRVYNLHLRLLSV